MYHQDTVITSLFYFLADARSKSELTGVKWKNSFKVSEIFVILLRQTFFKKQHYWDQHSENLPKQHLEN